MTKPPERRRPADPMKAAEAVFARTAPKLPEDIARPSALPGVKETVTLRIDQDVLEFFREDGPGWQERLNAALRKAMEDSRR
ncbi:MAG TPA: BrnA antitoxin family protein [Bauldia sp.]|nr:BrnA antitoxin family protein [Bauldia sp.]